MSKTIELFIMIILCSQSLSSQTGEDRYCNLESRCIVDDIITSPLHIGCPKSFANSPSLYTLIKLKYNDREFITNEFNQFRSDLAMGTYSNIFKYPIKPMNKLEWSHELEYLLSLMISKVPNTNFYCMATDISNRPSQLYVSLDRPQPFNLHKIFILAINEIKAKALESFRDANIGETVNWSQIYDTDASAVGCAIGEFKSINVNDKVLIRCSFYGSKQVKRNVTTYVSKLCPSNTQDSETFPELCEKTNLMTGDPGIDGLTGITGPNGRKGEKGNAGIIGEPGLVGYVGLMGDTGDQGPQGEEGEISNAGAPGDAGEDGECIKGQKGLPGPPGYPGEPGGVGLKGEKGRKGEQGETVSLISLKGEPGEQTKGAKGSKGDQGDIGDDGIKGVKGLKGIKGDAGTIDYEDDKCIICPPSPKGIPGLPGSPGEEGPAGTVKKSPSKSVTVEVTTQNYDIY